MYYKSLTFHPENTFSSGIYPYKYYENNAKVIYYCH